MENSFYMLKQVLNELKNIDGVIAYSIFQLPEDDNERLKILKKIINHKKKFILQ